MNEKYTEKQGRWGSCARSHKHLLFGSHPV